MQVINEQSKLSDINLEDKISFNNVQNIQSIAYKLWFKKFYETGPWTEYHRRDWFK